MRKTGLSKQITVLALTLCMLLGMVPAAHAADSSGGPDGTLAPDGQSGLETVQSPEDGSPAGASEPANPDETVRVSIVLDDPAPMAIGYSALEMTQAGRGRTYRTKLRETQLDLQRLIESEILDGETLDVVWNLTYAANIISANVKRSDIQAIRDLQGVKAVEEELHFTVGDEPMTAQPNMALSGSLTGADEAWASGYTGAGTKIAIIDSGLDTKHKSFDPNAFLYALSDEEKALLMTQADVEKYLPELNIKDMEGATADALYLNEKVPFAYNYVDESNTVDHTGEDASEHGSHVAGIAAANLYVNTAPEGEDPVYEDALDTVYVAGNAPDAQIIVMRVFGESGGAYESDYVAAIEDALVMGCDSVNLSLGSAMAGFAKSGTYQEIFDRLEQEDETVVVISSGNSGSWPENTASGKLYSDGVNFSTNGSPGSFTNALTVASVDNNGVIGRTLKVGAHRFGFTNPVHCELPNIYTLDGGESDDGTALSFIMLDESAAGHEEEYLTALLAENKPAEPFVLILWRGVSNFTVKVKAAQDAGAAAVLVANNADDTIAMDLEGLDPSVTIPAATILKADGGAIWSSAAEQKDFTAETISFKYITGTLNVVSKAVKYEGEGGEPVMSYFSSWGVPGSLELKPEITAPGGNIYSVYGRTDENQSETDGHDAYVGMSGTSMAAPQISGLVAQIHQYLSQKHPDYTKHSVRVLTQSLLMSTAKALKDGDSYYPVIQQGAGLANVAAAVTTPVYIIVDGQNDGKVKVELGDDALRKGEYTFGFTLYNLTNEAHAYALAGEMFTQLVEDGMLGFSTRALSADVTFEGGEKVTVGANGSAHVNVTVKLTDEEKAKLQSENPSGAYVEGFITATPETLADGGVLPTLSIPVLGFYGNWSDSPMFDLGDCDNWIDEDFTEFGGRVPYMYKDGVMLGYATNAVKANGALLKNGDGVSSLASIDYFYYTLIRNAGAMRVIITDKATKELLFEKNFVSDYAAYYSSGDWSLEQSSVYIGWTPPADLAEDAELEVTLIAAPEYYAGEDGKYDWAALTNGTLAENDPELGEGCYLHTTLTIDNDEPVIVSAEPVETEDGKKTIEVTVQDNVGVSRIALYSGDGSSLVYEFSGNYYTEDADGNTTTTFDRTAPGEQGTVTFDGKYSLNFILQIFGLNLWESRTDLTADVYRVVVEDIAGHEVSTRVFLDLEPTDNVSKVTITPSSLRMIPMRTATLTASVMPVNAKDRTVTWASEDETIATVDQNGNVTALAVGKTNITATSTLGEVVGKCAVTVQPVYVTINGIKVGADDAASQFSWDIAASDFQTGASVPGTPVGGAAVEGTGEMYLYDAQGNLYLVDANGNKLRDVATWPSKGGSVNANIAGGEEDSSLIPSAIDYSETGSFPGLWAAKDGDIYYYADPSDLNSYEVKLEKDLLKSSRKPPIIGIAVANQDWKYSSYKGDTVIYVVTAGGYVCSIGCFAQSGALKCVVIKANSTDLSNYVQLQGKDDFPMCDLMWTDNRLYLAARSNDGCTFLRLPTAMTAEDSSGTLSKTWDFMGKLDNATLDHVILGEVDRVRYDFNGDAKFDIADAQLLLDSIVAFEDLVDSISDQNVDGEGLKSYADTHDVHALLKILNNVDEEFENGSIAWPGSDPETTVTVPEIRFEGNRIYVPVYANNSSNGEILLLWDHMSSKDQNHLFTLEDVIIEKGDFVTSFFNAWDYFEEPDIYFGYAGAEPVNGLLFTMVLSFEPRDEDTEAYLELRISQEGLDGDTYDQSYTFNLPAAEVVTGESQVQAGEGAFGEDVDPETRQEVLDAVAQTQPNPVDLLNAVDVTVDGDDLTAAKDKLMEAGIDVKDTASVRIVSEAYLDVTVDIYAEDENGRTLALDIDAYYHLLATTAEKNSEMEEEGAGANTVRIDSVEYPISLSDPIELNVVLPTGFVSSDTKGIYVKHTKNGSSHYHQATVAENEGVLTATFTSTDGLSPFVFTSESVALAASIGDTYYATLQEAVDAARDGDTVTVLDPDAKATVSRSLTVTLDGTEDGIDTGDMLSAVGSCSVSTVTNEDGTTTYTFTYRAPAPSVYSITVADTRNGAVEASRQSASYGTTVVLTPKADTGYAVESVTVTDASGKAVNVTDKGDGTYTFNMPWSRVTVEVTFRFACDGKDECVSATFKDVDRSLWYHESVDYVVSHDLMVGGSDGIFSPDGTTTRAQLVTVLWRLDGAPAVENSGFDDVPETAWFAAPVAWAASRDIVDGYGNGSFGPDDHVTREQMVAILYRYAAYKGYDVSNLADLAGYTDAGSVQDWAVTPMRWAVAEGIIVGWPASALDPSGDSIRAQIATVLMRFCETYTK